MGDTEGVGRGVVDVVEEVTGTDGQVCGTTGTNTDRHKSGYTAGYPRVTCGGKGSRTSGSGFRRVVDTVKGSNSLGVVSPADIHHVYTYSNPGREDPIHFSFRLERVEVWTLTDTVMDFLFREGTVVSHRTRTSPQVVVVPLRLHRKVVDRRNLNGTFGSSFFLTSSSSEGSVYFLNSTILVRHTRNGRGSYPSPVSLG